MTPDNIVLLTGATGALGSWLTRAALADGTRVCAVARETAGGSAGDRVRASLAVTGMPHAPGLSVVEGDILDDNLGIADGQLPGRIGRVIHCAACTDFQESAAELSYQSNVVAVKNVLDFARRHGAPLVHLSTAYVAGTRTGRVHEDDLDLGQGFNNVYERTKCQGEALVRQWAADTGLPAIILRPSIVAGDWQGGRALRFNTLYDMMHAMDALAPAARGERLRVVAQAGATKNIIPVDYFAEAAWRIIRRGRPGTFHIVHPRPLTLTRLARIFAELFSVEEMPLVSQEEFTRDRPTHAERVCHRAMAQYRPYMTQPEPVFDRTATDQALAGSGIEAPELDVAWFRRLLGYALQVDWGRKPRNTPVAAPATASAREYFDVFLPGKLGRNLLPDLRRLTACFGIALREDTDIHWALDVQEGVLRTVSHNGMPTACRFTIDTPTLLEIVAGRLTPQRAFFSRQAEISGDVALGLKIAAVMAQFFRKFPFESVTG